MVPLKVWEMQGMFLFFISLVHWYCRQKKDDRKRYNYCNFVVLAVEVVHIIPSVGPDVFILNCYFLTSGC